jgi:hypothetical protein
VDRRIWWTTTGCGAMLALIGATVSYLHIYMLAELQGQPGWVAAPKLMPVDRMIVATPRGFWPGRLLVGGAECSHGRCWW